MQWDLNRLMPDGQTEHSLVSFQLACDQSSTRWFHGTKFVVPAGEYSQQDVEPLIVRMLCHLIIDNIPDQGMAETCESLKGLYDYYKPVERPGRELPEVRRHPATIGTQTIRPEFSLEE